MTDTQRQHAQKNVPTAKRRYLPSAERKREILQAAFEEFSQHGYLGTSLERIALRAGISKSGIYAHYSSKDKVFEDMLNTALSLPSNAKFDLPDLDDASTLSCMVEEYLDQLYPNLSSPNVLAVFRLLLNESGRVPDLARYWVTQLTSHNYKLNQSFFESGVKKGLIRPNVQASDFTLAASPCLLWILSLMTLGEHESLVTFGEVRQLHKRLLIERLQPTPA